ncbi:hemolysin family protein [Actinomyces vulturis]|uniref:hemolysin family protein n=1 Tax=Actinomyces vulturis TaxID=1857645 RepID=UPI0008377D7A|nr:hemolysin family protein [Actinomyces vulturis]
MLLDLLMLVLGVILTLGTAVFVAGEFSLVALDPATVESRAVAGDRRAGTVRQALHSLSTLLSGAQVGITLTTILLGYTAQAALTRLLERWLGSFLSAAIATATAVVIALIVINAFSMIVGELIPKNATLADPMRAARVVAPPLMAFTAVFKPLVIVLNNAANKILASWGVEACEEMSGARSASELTALVRHSAQEGTLDMSTATLLTRSIGVGELTAVDVMTDRGRIHCLHEDDTAADVVSMARATGHSRFPIIGEDLDDVLGLVNLRKAIAVPFEKRAHVPVTSSSLMTPSPRVPETVPLAQLLVHLRAEGLQMALVQDEYGGTAGIVTLEDAIEEIVGDVADEHDRRRSGAYVETSGQWIVPGWMRPDELAHSAHIYLPDDGPYETLGGLVMTELGRIPRVGDEVTTLRAHLVVEAMDGMRITRLRVWSLNDSEETQA